MGLTLSHYRFGKVELAQNTHGFLAGEDRDTFRMPGANGQFLLRFCVQADATGLNNVDNEFQYRLNGGAWTNITTTSAVVRTGANSVFTNGQNCTKRLSGTGTFEASGAGCTHDGTSGGTANDIVANGCSETEIGLQIIGTDVVVGDLIEFRLTRDGGVLLDAYAVIPAVRVSAEILAVQSRDPGDHNSIAVTVVKIRNAQVTVAGILSDTDLVDDTLSVEMNVWGSLDGGSSYTQHLYGPDIWFGSPTLNKQGVLTRPGFTFAEDIPNGVNRVRATFNPSKTVTLGAEATLIEGVEGVG